MANLQQPQITAADTQLTEEELKAKLQQGFKNAIAQQEAQANAMRAMLAQQMIQEGQKGVLGNLDLRKFAQAAKQYGATTAVVPTEAPEDDRNMMLKLQQAIAEQQQGLGKQQLDYLKSQLEAKQRGAQDRRLETSLRGAAFREMKEGVTPFIKINDASETAFADFKPMERIFSQDEIPIKELTSIVTKFGRRMGEVGAQSEGDRKAYWDPDLGTTFLSAIQKVSGDKQTISRTDPNVEAMINAMNDAKESMAGSIASKGTYMKDIYGTEDSPIGYMFQEGKQGDIAHKKLMGTSEKLKSLQFGAPKTPALMSEEQKKKLQELRAKYRK